MVKEKDNWDKLNIVVSNIILVAIPIVIGVVGDNISRSLERSELIESLLDDLTSTEAETRRDIALIALDSAIPPPKDESKPNQVVDIAEIVLKGTIVGVSEKQEIIQRTIESSAAKKIILKRKPQTGEKIVQDISGDALSTFKTTEDNGRENGEKGQVKEMSEIEQSKKIISSLLPDKKFIYITFRGSLTRELINKIRESFQEDGWIAPQALRRADGYENSVKYFHESDRTLAESVKTKTQEFFTSQNCTKQEVKVEDNSSENRNEGEIELWIHNSCQGTN